MRNGLSGLAEGWQRERSLRTQLILSVAGLAVLVVSAAGAHWLVAYFVLAVLGLAAELLNGALEAALDRLHPSDDADIGAAKDMSSAAALVINLAAAAVFVWALLS